MATVSTIPTSDWRYQTAPTNLRRLLTVFTPPAECSTRWIYDGTSTSEIYSGRAVFSYYEDEVDSAYYYDCNPYRATATTPLYSPGVCGDGQKPAEIDEVRLDYVYWLAYCCPSDMYYRFVDRDGYYCEKTFSEATTVLSRFTTVTTYSGGETSFLTTYSSGETATIPLIDITEQVCTATGETCSGVTKNSKTVLTTGTARAKPTVVFWQSSDLSLMPRDYASSIAAVISVPFGSYTPGVSPSLSTPAPSMTSEDSGPSTSAQSIESQDKSSGLSPGAKAGIGVGVGIFVILGVVFLLFLWRRRKQQRQQKQAAPQQEQEPSGEIGVSEMDSDANGSKRFVGGHWRAETEGSSALVEAGSTSVHIVPGPPVELDATHTRGGE